MRLADVDALIDRHRERFRRLLEEIVAEEAGEDPFAFPLERFQALSEEDKAELVKRASILARARVERGIRPANDLRESVVLSRYGLLVQPFPIQ